VKPGKKKVRKSFVAKLTDSEGEAREIQTWLLFARKCIYINEDQFIILNNQYNQIIGMLVNMMSKSKNWCTFSSINKD
jgi:S23 ribosomal protein.